jgi:hypothetical protein
MAEKMLFQIAVERIVDRISKLPKEKSERIIKIFTDFKTFDCGVKFREDSSKEIFEMLFPELNREVQSRKDDGLPHDD